MVPLFVVATQHSRRGSIRFMSDTPNPCIEAAAIAWHHAVHADSPAFVTWSALAAEDQERARLHAQRLATGAAPADRADRVALDVLRALDPAVPAAPPSEDPDFLVELIQSRGPGFTEKVAAALERRERARK